MRNSQLIIRKSKNTIWRNTILCFINCALSIVLISCGATNSTAPQETKTEPTIALWPASDGITSDTMHLGRVKEGEIVKSQFIVHNISSEPLVIIDIKVACGCAKATFDTKPVMGGEKRTINYTFNSSGRSGIQIKYFELQSADNRNIKIFFDAEVI